MEDISLEYTFAQSVLFKIYDRGVQETGHKTTGHLSLTEEDRAAAQQLKGSLLYGELLPRGVNKVSRLLDPLTIYLITTCPVGSGPLSYVCSRREHIIRPGHGDRQGGHPGLCSVQELELRVRC